MNVREVVAEIDELVLKYKEFEAGVIHGQLEWIQHFFNLTDEDLK